MEKTLLFSYGSNSCKGGIKFPAFQLGSCQKNDIMKGGYEIEEPLDSLVEFLIQLACVSVAIGSERILLKRT